MLAEQVRSGLVEASHDGAVAVVGGDGSLIASSGDIDRPFFLRSSAKPFQGLVSQESGADLSPLQLSIACASHRGFPVQVALVRAMLDEAGLEESALRTPLDWPIGVRAQHLVLRSGAEEPRRIWHNCSGKHAGFLRACVARGWQLDSYLDPRHPLQERVLALLSELGEQPVEPAGVDGCGAPIGRTTARGMALMYARLATEERLAGVFGAMHRYPALVGANGEGDSEIATASNTVAKGGAAGCIGVAVEGRFGIAVKSWDGLGQVANIGAISALRQLGALSRVAVEALEAIGRPVVLGGGVPVGTIEARLELVAS